MAKKCMNGAEEALLLKVYRKLLSGTKSWIRTAIPSELHITETPSEFRRLRRLGFIASKKVNVYDEFGGNIGTRKITLTEAGYEVARSLH